MKKNQNGFSAVEALIIVVILGVVGFGGWFIMYKQQKTDNKPTTNNGVASQSKNNKKDSKTSQQTSFDCKGIFTVKLPDGFEGLLNDGTEQCVITNADKSDWPDVGPFPPNRMALFFNIDETNTSSSSQFLEESISSNIDYPSTIQSKEKLMLDSGDEAALFLVNGGHPVVRDYYSFAYVEKGKVITTSYEANSDYKEAAQGILKSIALE